MPHGTFRLAHIKHLVDGIAANTQFPIADAPALEAAFGGASTTVALGDEQHGISEVHQIPADYFPIGSAEDLFTKLAALRSANGDQPEDLVVTGKRRTDPPPHLEHHREPAHHLRHSGPNAPAVVPGSPE